MLGHSDDTAILLWDATARIGARLPTRLMIDCSHGNSGKDHRRQSVVAHDIAAQVAGGETAIVGVMMESFLVEGRQDLTNTATLRYGQSITDACMSCDATLPTQTALAKTLGARPPGDARMG